MIGGEELKICMVCGGRGGVYVRGRDMVWGGGECGRDMVWGGGERGRDMVWGGGERGMVNGVSALLTATRTPQVSISFYLAVAVFFRC